MSAPMHPPALALVDLDGTLIDTLPDLAFCVDEMLARLGSAPVGERRVRAWVGDGVGALVERALAERPETDADGQAAHALELFMELYAEHTATRSRVYEGVHEGLAYLRDSGVALGCVTNKSQPFTGKLLSAFELDAYFPLVVSGDSVPRKKPHPMPLLHAARHFDVDPAQSLLIGDSKNDIDAARAAGFRIVCVTYGYHHGDDIRDGAPDALIDSLAELPKLFAGALA